MPGVTRKFISCTTILFFLAVWLFLAAGLVTPTQAQTPSGHWTFEEGVGTEAADSSGNGHTATLANGVSWVSSPMGSGVAANGSARQFVSIPPIRLSETRAMTVSMWANRTYSTSGGTVLFEAGYDYGASRTAFWLLPDDGTCHGIQAGLRGDVGSSSNCYGQPTSGAWHHLAVVFDKSQSAGSAVALYVDGLLQAPTWNVGAATNSNNFGNDPIYLFAREGISAFGSGMIADLQIYNTALSAEQIQQIYRRTALKSLTVAPPSVSISTGTHVQFKATATYQDGSTKDLTNSAAWTATDPSVGSISRGGIGIGAGTGKTAILASLGRISASAGLMVTTGANSIIASTSQAGQFTGWQQGFDFRNTPNFVTDPSGSVYVLATTAYPTATNGVTYGWTNTSLVQAYDRSTTVDPRLAGTNVCTNGKAATFYVDVPSPGIYSIQMAMGDASYTACATQCQVQLLDGTTVLATISGGSIAAGHFYDANRNQWSSAQWPTSNQPRQVTLSGTRLAVVVGANQLLVGSVGQTPLAYLGLTEVSGGGDFTLTASPTSVTVAQGSQGSSTLTTTVSGGFNNAITLSASGVPSGTTVGFSPNPIAAPGAGSSTMTIAVGTSTAPGTYTLTVTGSGGGLQHTATVSLTVNPPPNFTLTASPTSVTVAQGSQGSSTLTTTVSGGFNNAITLSAAGVPSGTTVGFSPNPIAAPGAGSSTMTIAVGTSTAPGTYTLTVTGSGGGTQHTAIVSLTVNPPADFTLAASPTSVTVAQGSQGSSTLTTTVSGGFNNAITLSASGVPSGTTVGFSPNPIAAPGAGSSTMTIAVGTSTAPGTYTLTVTGSGGGLQHTATVSLTVNPPPNFTLTASPTSVTVAQGSQGSSTLTTTVSGGFNNAITLSAAGVPSGTTVGFSPNPIAAPGAGSSTMTIAVGTSTAPGTYSLTVTGSGGGLQHTATVSLTVNPPADFTLVASPTSVTVAQGSQGSSTLTTTVSGGFNNAITLSASGVPSGTTVGFSPNPIAAPGTGSSTMTIAVGTSTAPGTYTLTITGSGGGLQHTATVSLTVNPPHQVSLSWTASTSQNVVGYNAYRSLTSGGGYTKVNTSLITSTSYIDQTVLSGVTYYYVTTAVDSQGLESVYSNQAAAIVP